MQMSNFWMLPLLPPLHPAFSQRYNRVRKYSSLLTGRSPTYAIWASEHPPPHLWALSSSTTDPLSNNKHQHSGTPKQTVPTVPPKIWRQSPHIYTYTRNKNKSWSFRRTHALPIRISSTKSLLLKWRRRRHAMNVVFLAICAWELPDDISYAVLCSGRPCVLDRRFYSHVQCLCFVSSALILRDHLIFV